MDNEIVGYFFDGNTFVASGCDEKEEEAWQLIRE